MTAHESNRAVAIKGRASAVIVEAATRHNSCGPLHYRRGMVSPVAGTHAPESRCG
jgi:hypothetical protein